MPGRRRPGLGPNKRIEIDGEDIGFDDLDIGKHAETQAELCGQDAVEFHCDQAAGAFGQQGSEDAASGTDFEHGILRNIAEGIHNLQAKLSLARKCCPSLGLSCGRRVETTLAVDPLFLGHID